MRKQTLLFMLVAVFGLGLIAAGCGSSNSSTSSTAATSATTDTTASSTDSTSTDTSSTTSTSSSSGTSPDDVYNACIDVVKGTAAEAAGTTACQQAKDAFQQCEDQAGSLSGDSGAQAEQICQDAADKAISTLKAAG